MPLVNSSFKDNQVQISHRSPPLPPNARSPCPTLCQELFLSICQFISLSVYLCPRFCVCLLSACVCAYVWASATSVFPPSVAWATVALHEMNALFPPRFQMWCSVWTTAASRPTSPCSSPAATGWPPCSAALSWRATLRRLVVWISELRAN